MNPGPGYQGLQSPGSQILSCSLSHRAGTPTFEAREAQKPSSQLTPLLRCQYQRVILDRQPHSKDEKDPEPRDEADLQLLRDILPGSPSLASGSQWPERGQSSVALRGPRLGLLCSCPPVSPGTLGSENILSEEPGEVGQQLCEGYL